jgi:hypothetical protein
MNDTIWQQIAATSWVVFIAFGLIAYRGYLITKPKIVPVRQLATSVLLFASTSIVSLYLFTQFNLLTTKWWGVLMLCGLAGGWIYYWRLNIICFREERNLMIPGSWLNSLILMGSTAIIYLTNSQQIPTDPDALMAGSYSDYIITFYGLSTGFVMGRFLYAMYLVRKTIPAH